MNHALTSTIPRLWLLIVLAGVAACGGRSNPPPDEHAGASHAEEEHVGHEHAAEKHADEQHDDEQHDGDEHAPDEEAGHVELTPEQIKAGGIGLEEARPEAIRTTLRLYGVIVPNAERMREVSARYPGVIRSVARAVGDTVGQGETLAMVEGNESLRTFPVTAPISGVVTARAANPGEQTGERILFTVADLDTVWVELALFPRDLAKVRVGQEVTVRGDAGGAGDAKLVFVAPIGNSASQTLVARAELPNGQRQWAPGLYVTAEVTLDKATVPVAVRSEALQTVDERPVVFVAGEHGFEPRPVGLGRSDGRFTEVTEGLKPGETYAAANSFVLKSELGKGEAKHEH